MTKQMDVDWTLYHNSPQAAADELGAMLHKGELALFLGAGVSLDLGVPRWHTLARAMAIEAGLGNLGITPKRRSGSTLAGVFSQIKAKDPAGFNARVKKWLYYRWSPKSGNWASSTLVALGALICGSSRGRVEHVLTLNFDSVLEMYLRLYGYVPQSVTTFPCMLHRADAYVFHSHGYLPFDSRDGRDTDILLDEQTYFEAMGEAENHQRRMLEFVFGSKCFLAIGLSGDDPFSRSVLAAIAKRDVGRSIVGFWVIGPQSPADVPAALKRSKVAAVRITSYRDLPEFLFSVARRAAALSAAV